MDTQKINQGSAMGSASDHTLGAAGQSPLSVTATLPAAKFPPQTVGDLMTRRIITMNENEAIGELEGWMERFRFHHLPVVDASMKLTGLITRTDYLHAQLGRDPEGSALEPLSPDTLASAIMRKKVVFAATDHSLRMACDLMLREKLGCLPVVLDDKTLVGIITNTDFVRLARQLLER